MNLIIRPVAQLIMINGCHYGMVIMLSMEDPVRPLSRMKLRR
jgi:hypothetical protein